MTLHRIAPLLDFIAEPESGDDYNIVWGGIEAKDRPPKPLTRMTVREVLAWQDSIDPHYNSEAAGRYQILEDTLRGLYRAAGIDLDDRFDERTQDKLAYQLCRRRGLDDYLDGAISVEKFCNSLAKEWASLPVVTGPKKGRSYYGGDGLNAAHVGVSDFLAAVRAIRPVPEKPMESDRPPEPPQPPSQPGMGDLHSKQREGFAWLAAAVFAILAAILGFGG